MLVYLDTVVCVYAVEGDPPFQARALERLILLRAAGDRLAVSDLTWLECRVKPMRLGLTAVVSELEKFLSATDIVRLPLGTNVFESACRIMSVHNFKLADALHLATAVEGGCDLVLTNDHRLTKFAEITVEILP